MKCNEQIGAQVGYVAIGQHLPILPLSCQPVFSIKGLIICTCPTTTVTNNNS